jgi:polyisoprenoid-binding protein YceI
MNIVGFMRACITPFPPYQVSWRGSDRIWATMTFVTCALAILSSTVAQRMGHARAIDVRDSKVIVQVFKTSVFSAFGDNHEVEAPISEGFVDEGASRVTFAIESQRMKVLDPDLSPDKRRQVQERMLGPEVLDVTHFPQIKFESTTVEQASPRHLLVHGRLSLHGVTRPLIVNVQTENGRYVGEATLKQRDFGITPISIAGGSVKVKDELRIKFDIRTNTQTAVVTK